MGSGDTQSCFYLWVYSFVFFFETDSVAQDILQLTTQPRLASNPQWSLCEPPHLAPKPLSMFPDS